MSETKKRISRSRSCRAPQRKDPAAQYHGAINKALGALFEARVADSLKFYERAGEAVVEKTPEPMRPTKSLGGGKFIAYYESAAQPDYKGVLKGGQAVVFEAKYTTTGRMEQSRVTTEQAERLDRYCAVGAEGFVLAGFGDDYVYRIPWHVWKDMKEYAGRKYVTPDDLEEYRLRIGPGRIILIFD